MRRSPRARGLIVLAVLACLGGALVGVSWRAFWGDIPFDLVEWKALEDPGGPLGSQFYGYNRRARMVRDLLDHHVRPGMRWGEARALLGDCHWGGDGQYSYCLVWNARLDQKCACLIRWGAADPVLQVTIDREDGSLDARVTKAEVVRG